MFQFPNAKMVVDRNAKRVVLERLDEKLEKDTEFDAEDLKKWLAEQIDFIYKDLDKRVHGQRVIKVEADDPKFSQAITENWNGCIERIRAVIAAINIEL